MTHTSLSGFKFGECDFGCQFTTYSFYSWAELDRSDTGLKYWYFKLEGDTDLTDDTGK